MASDEERPPETWASPVRTPSHKDEESDESDFEFAGTRSFGNVVPADPEKGRQQQQRQQQQQGAVAFGLQPRIALRLARQGIALAAMTLVLSFVSFEVVGLYFLWVLRLPSGGAKLPAGYDSWTSCLANATRPAVTAIGHELPLNTARALTSLPKFFEVALLALLAGCLISRWQPRLSCITGLMAFMLPAIAAPVYAFPDWIGVTAVPAIVDPSVTSTTGILFTVTHCVLFIRPRCSSTTDAVAGHPKLAFCVAMALVCGSSAVLESTLAVLAGTGVHAGVVVCATFLLARLCSFTARCIFGSLNLPNRACFAIMFTHQLSMVLPLRRYWLALPELGDVAVASSVSAALELCCNAASSLYAVRRYRLLEGEGRAKLARAQTRMFFSAIVCDLIAEHAALHGALGYHLFLDPRLLTIDVQSDRQSAIRAWAASLAVELAVDVAFAVPLIAFLPVRADRLLRRCLRSRTVLALLVCACAHCHLVGLHAYLDEARYLCE